MEVKISKKIGIVIAIVISTCLITIATLTACSQEKIKQSGPYPNKIAESAQISDKYKDIANKLSDDAINEFLALTKIPREYGNMDGIRNYIINWANTNGHKAILDSSGCVYIDILPSAGHEKDKNLILQAHMDMVVTTDPSYTNFDKNTTGIDAVYDKEAGTICSRDRKTSLGADDGEGLGLCLAIAKNDTKFEHGPIRLLFTYDEETTMEGAKKLSADVINADYLINFDNSPCCFAATSSAGILPIEFTKKYPTAAPTEKGMSQNMTFKIDGLKGGHAGTDINKGNASASAILTKYLNELTDKKVHFRIVSIDCGQAHNAIPTNMTLTLNINKKHEEEARQAFEDVCNQTKKESQNDSEMNSEITVTDASGMFPSQQDSEKIQNILNCLPNGIIEKDAKYKDVVSKSCNIGIVRFSDGQLYVRASYRSSDNQDIQDQRNKITQDLKALKIDWQVSDDAINPAWPESDSNIAKFYEKAMKDECKITPTLTSVHAALETSPLVVKKPGLQVISIGGDVANEHTTNETFYTKTFPVAIVPVLYILDHINEL